jgi:hypothetical protein
VNIITLWGNILSSLLKNPIFVILSEAKDRISVGDSSAFGLRMTQLGLFQQTVSHFEDFSKHIVIEKDMLWNKIQAGATLVGVEGLKQIPALSIKRSGEECLFMA